MIIIVMRSNGIGVDKLSRFRQVLCVSDKKDEDPRFTSFYGFEYFSAV